MSKTIGTAAAGTAHDLKKKIEDKSLVIGVLGLGYVGLPLALAFAEKSFAVVGFDVDPSKVEALKAGHSYIKHLEGTRLQSATTSGLFRPTSDFDELSGPDVLLICVPTPLTPQREPEMSFIVNTAKEIRARLRAGQLVVLESTTYPGTTDELVRGILEESGLQCGRDFYLAFSPEREDPGNPRFATATIPKVVGGVDPVSGDLAQAVYDQAITRTVRVSSSRAAEATKLVENIFRAVNIALVNELKMVFDKMDIDVWEVLDAASTKPFGFMSLALIEALAGGAVLVTSDKPEISQFVQHEENGLLIRDYLNPAAIAAAIQRACTDQDLRRTIKANARASVEKFERSRIDALEASYYETVLAMRDRGEFSVPLATRASRGIERNVRRIVPKSLKAAIRPILEATGISKAK